MSRKVKLIQWLMKPNFEEIIKAPPHGHSPESFETFVTPVSDRPRGRTAVVTKPEEPRNTFGILAGFSWFSIVIGILSGCFLVYHKWIIPDYKRLFSWLQYLWINTQLLLFAIVVFVFFHQAAEIEVPALAFTLPRLQRFIALGMSAFNVFVFPVLIMLKSMINVDAPDYVIVTGWMIFNFQLGKVLYLLLVHLMSFASEFRHIRLAKATEWNTRDVTGFMTESQNVYQLIDGYAETFMEIGGRLSAMRKLFKFVLLVCFVVDYSGFVAFGVILERHWCGEPVPETYIPLIVCSIVNLAVRVKLLAAVNIQATKSAADLKDLSLKLDNSVDLLKAQCQQALVDAQEMGFAPWGFPNIDRFYAVTVAGCFLGVLASVWDLSQSCAGSSQGNKTLVG